jgi:hypothetical protein
MHDHEILSCRLDAKADGVGAEWRELMIFD